MIRKCVYLLTNHYACVCISVYYTGLFKMIHPISNSYIMGN